MTRLSFLVVPLVISGLAILTVYPALAADHGATRNVVVVGENGEKATVTFDGSRLTVTAEEGDDISVQEVDLAEIAAMVDDALAGAMVGVEAALDAFAESDIEVRMESDHQLVVQADGKSTTIDLGAMMAAVAEAMDDIAVEFDADAADEGELEQEIANLRAEIERLRAELPQR
jgi:hypothetical protein